MSDKYFIYKAGLRHYLKATTIYQEHSPFFYDLWKEVLNHRAPAEVVDQIKAYRKDLLNDPSQIKNSSIGAGSRRDTDRSSVAQVTRISSSSLRKCTMLYQLRKHYALDRSIEVGTNLGMATFSLGLARPNARLISLEGNESYIQQARKRLSTHANLNIEIMHGRFDATLNQACKDLGSVDLVFLDGDHTYEATLENFKTLLPFLHERSVVVIDDIWWSEGMLQAFETIRNHTMVTSSLAYRGIGFIFFDKSRPYKLHLDWVDRRLKPWTYIYSL